MIDPQDIDPDTGRPYPGYSSPSLDTSFHDAEMDVDDPPGWVCGCGFHNEDEAVNVEIECASCGRRTFVEADQ